MRDLFIDLIDGLAMGLKAGLAVAVFLLCVAATLGIIGMVIMMVSQ